MSNIKKKLYGITLQPDPPCDLGCGLKAECKAKNQACGAWRKYVSSGDKWAPLWPRLRGVDVKPLADNDKY